MLATVAVPKVNSWHRQIVQVLAEIDLCRTHIILIFSVENNTESDIGPEEIPLMLVGHCYFTTKNKITNNRLCTFTAGISLQ
jgi:hypothetical protein